jgi:hypothetical protein
MMDMIDYSRDPDPPFGEPDATWVREVARTMAAPPAEPPPSSPAGANDEA